MKTSINKISILSVTIALLVLCTIPFSSYASNPDFDDSNNGNVATDSDFTDKFSLTDYETAMDGNDAPVISYAIGSGVVSVSKTSKTNLKYTFTTTLTSKADSATVVVNKYIYSSSKKKYVKSGASQTKTYSSVSKIIKSGNYAISSGNSYKIRVRITEKRGSITNTKTFYSKVI